METIPSWIYTSIIGVVCLIAGWGFALFLRKSSNAQVTRDKQDETNEQSRVTAQTAARNVISIDELIKRTNEQDRQIVILQSQISPFWSAVQTKIAEDLHHPEPEFAEMDNLLEQLESLTITEGGRTKLKGLLVERSDATHPAIKPSERGSAQLMLSVMEKVLTEAEDSPRESVIDLTLVDIQPKINKLMADIVEIGEAKGELQQDVKEIKSDVKEIKSDLIK